MSTLKLLGLKFHEDVTVEKQLLFADLYFFFFGKILPKESSYWTSFEVGLWEVLVSASYLPSVESRQGGLTGETS